MASAAPIPRHASARIIEALADTRIVTVEGPRQAGKSTLCATIAAAHGMRAVTLDDAAARRAANDDPSGFLAGLGERAFIDELQRAPELVLALKAEVDRDPRPGRYLVSGSVNLLLAPRIGDSLAGRVERVPLRPFAQSELERSGVPAWLDALWRGGRPPYIETAAVGRSAHAERIVKGGFPPVVARSARRGDRWLEDYLAALATRDVPDLADIRRPDLLPVLLRHLASGSGSLVALRPIAQALAVDEKTVRTYVRLLELLHLVVRVPAWTPGLAARAVRAPRTVIEDSGLLAHLLDADPERIAADDTITGLAYESWVMMELARLLPHTEVAPAMRHWRSRHGEEVDVVLEDRGGRVIAIEIKAGASPGHGDFRGLRQFRELTGERFAAGLVLCTTRQTIPVGARMWAVPIEALWAA
ncbi:MAG TPA: ATP-binding protein [Solirubrobacteraceae bacterium]|jgi:predicted AAA+ superfamily ATPase|nr:ATP-binding protein [Solirubrobacteraceae bacterium]